MTRPRSNPYRRLEAMPLRLHRQAKKAMAELDGPASRVARERLDEFGKPGPLEDYDKSNFVPPEFDDLVEYFTSSYGHNTRFKRIKECWADLNRPKVRWEHAKYYAESLARDIEEELQQVAEDSARVKAFRNYEELFPRGALGEPDRTHPDWPYFAERWAFDGYLAPALAEVRADVARLETVLRHVRHVLNERARAEATRSTSSKQRPGGFDVWPKDIDPVETMFHVTTAYRAILKEGFKSQEELGGDAPGLGGAVDGISFTASLEVAEGILYAMMALKDFMGGPRSIEWLRKWAKRHGLSNEDWKVAVEESGVLYGSVHSPAEAPKTRFQARLYPGAAMALFSRVLRMMSARGLVYDPLFVFVNRPEKYGDLDDRDIGIITADIDMAAPGLLHLSEMEEWRVPIPHITNYRGLKDARSLR